MSVQYQQQIDDEDDDDEVEMTRTEIIFSQMTASRGQHWPRAIGVVEIVVGIILTILGALEVFIVPMAESEDGKNLVIFDKTNCYGAGLYAGLLMVITGSTALRATLSGRDTTVLRFFNLTIISLLAYTGLTIWLIVAYAEGWTAPEKYKKGSSMREVHVFLTIFTVLGLLFALTGFVQYFDVICCGEVPLWRSWVRCCCPCIYRKREGAQECKTVEADVSLNHNSSHTAVI